MKPQEAEQADNGQHVVILCHPEHGSFNHSIADTYCKTIKASGQEVVLRDLYAMGFDPVLKAGEQPGEAFTPSPDIVRELAVIDGGDVFVLVYPIWFGTPPAMMKGYVERVLGSGVSPDAIQHQRSSALLGSKRLLSFTTSATGNVWLAEQGQEMGLGSVFDQYLLHAFGMHSQEHVRFDYITDGLSDRFARQYLRDVADKARHMCAEVAFGDEALLHNPRLVENYPQ